MKKLAIITAILTLAFLVIVSGPLFIMMWRDALGGCNG